MFRVTILVSMNHSSGEGRIQSRGADFQESVLLDFPSDELGVQTSGSVCDSG